MPPELLYCGYQIHYTAIGKLLCEPPLPPRPEPTGWISDLPVGTLAIRVFRAVRIRRLATPPERRKKPDPYLIAELRRRGWDLPEDRFGPNPTGPR